MSYIEQEKAFDRAVVFLSSAASTQATLPVASILHSIRVGLSLQQQGYSKEVILAGFLHDVVEDTHATVEEVEAQFGVRVAELVRALTFDMELEPQRRSQDSVDRCKLLGKEALAIKAADLLDNLHFYLADANPSRFGQLAESLKYFLDASVEELGQENDWVEVDHQRKELLARMAKENLAR